MSVPKKYRECFQAIVEKRIKENLEQLKKDRKALRLLDKEKTEPIYGVVIVSCWQSEKNVLHEDKGDLQAVLKAAEKKFQKINNRIDIDGYYYAGMKIGSVDEKLPKKLWAKWKKRG